MAKSFLSRLSLLNNDSAPILPLHASTRSRSPLRQAGDYDLLELSPRPDDGLLAFGTEPTFAFAGSSARTHASMHKQRRSPPPSPSREKVPVWAPPSGTGAARPVLFDSPPPPIATSVLLYRDVEDRGGALQLPTRRSIDRSGSQSTVLFDQEVAYENDSLWASLHRRECSIQRDIQTLLDVQSAGLLAGLGRAPLSPSLGSDADSTGGSTRDGRGRTRGTASIHTTTSTVASTRSRLPTDRATATGAVIPVRQPRPPKKLGLRGARAGLGRDMAKLASLKAEEDVSLSAALATRTRALQELRQLVSRRDSITGELHALEADEDEPLTRELSTLNSAHADTIRQIDALETQLAMLRSRKRTLEGRIADAQSQRDAGLSGYRGALREVEAQLAAVLERPLVQPLDVEALRGGSTAEDKDEEPGGMEFVRLRPERRTTAMASSWWAGEVAILERRRAAVAMERTALVDGGAVWEDVVRCVSNFEASLRKQMRAEDVGDADMGKGKAPEPRPEDMMQAQLERMAEIIVMLRAHLRTAEDRGWNLLLCAIGAELEAFQEARYMLREALRAAGFDVADEDEPRTGGGGGIDEEDASSTPRLAQSVAGKTAPKPTTPRLMDTEDGHDHGYYLDHDPDHDHDHDHGTSESDDNDVPPDLFATRGDDEHSLDGLGERGGHLHDRDDNSENEVPLEFLSERP